MNLSHHQQFTNKIKNMLQHANKIIQTLLRNLKYLYDTNGIYYPVDGYCKTLIRLLTPYELLSHFHLVDNVNLIKPIYNEFGIQQNQQDLQMKLQCKYQAQYKQLRADSSYNKLKKRQRQSDQRIDRHYQQYLKQKKQNQTKKQRSRNSNSQSSPYTFQHHQKSNHQQYKSSLILQATQQPNPIIGSKPLLGHLTQKQVALWTLDQLCHGNKLKFRHIAHHAKQLANSHRTFQGSVGWVNRFLMRYPLLKYMLKLSKSDKFGQICQLRQKALLQIGNINLMEPIYKQQQKNIQQNGYHQVNCFINDVSQLSSFSSNSLANIYEEENISIKSMQIIQLPENQTRVHKDKEISQSNSNFVKENDCQNQELPWHRKQGGNQIDKKMKSGEDSSFSSERVENTQLVSTKNNFSVFSMNSELTPTAKLNNNKPTKMIKKNYFSPPISQKKNV